MIVLGIESSCDDTSIAVVQNGRNILSLLIASQADLHAGYGGVFPEMASREHAMQIIPTLQKALTQANIQLEQIDLIAVTQGPGLVGSLLVGITVAKTLSIFLNKPIVGVNHVEAHIYAAMMKEYPVFPALGMVISGGHTFITKMDGISSYEVLASTVDDAVGESFDKVAKMLSLPYPGGPYIEKLALEGDPLAFPFRPGVVKTNERAFSFSGLKTAVLYAIEGLKKEGMLEERKADIAASFQHAVFCDIAIKVKKCLAIAPARILYCGGGVVQNRSLRAFLQGALSVECKWPDSELSVDNAAMIAGLGYHIYLEKGSTPIDSLLPYPRLERYKIQSRSEAAAASVIQ